MTRLGSVAALLLPAVLYGVAACKGQGKSSTGGSGENRRAVAVRVPGPDSGVPDPDPEIVVLSRIAVKTIDPSEEPAIELYPRELAQQLGRALGQSGFFASIGDGVPDGHRPRPATLEITISYEFLDGVNGDGGDKSARGQRKRQPTAVIAIESELIWDDGGKDPAPGENILVERRLSADERKRAGSLLAVHVAQAMVQVGRGLVAKERIRVGGVEALGRALDDSDVDMALWSLDLIGYRKELALFDQVVGNLGSEQHMVRDRSLTALVAMGDPRAVDALAKEASFDDREFLPSVIEAIIALGGSDAREYLEFVASGHPDEDIKERAREGLERLTRRGQK
ncbi:MAG: HEAT repeat domain-containing protein [Proteobacteria bacterium]|nr:HEAT repeat domain-containing protein [Pseudomonadota bacterium]